MGPIAVVLASASDNGGFGKVSWPGAVTCAAFFFAAAYIIGKWIGRH